MKVGGARDGPGLPARAPVVRDGDLARGAGDDGEGRGDEHPVVHPDEAGIAAPLQAVVGPDSQDESAPIRQVLSHGEAHVPKERDGLEGSARQIGWPGERREAPLECRQRREAGEDPIGVAAKRAGVEGDVEHVLVERRRSGSRDPLGENRVGAHRVRAGDVDLPHVGQAAHRGGAEARDAEEVAGVPGAGRRVERDVRPVVTERMQAAVGHAAGGAQRARRAQAGLQHRHIDASDDDRGAAVGADQPDLRAGDRDAVEARGAAQPLGRSHAHPAGPGGKCPDREECGEECSVAQSHRLSSVGQLETNVDAIGAAPLPRDSGSREPDDVVPAGDSQGWRGPPGELGPKGVERLSCRRRAAPRRLDGGLERAHHPHRRPD